MSVHFKDAKDNQQEMGWHQPSHRSRQIRNVQASLFDQGIGLLAEEVFHKQLYLERKRTERSGNPFLLMLIDIEKIWHLRKGDQLLEDMGEALCSSTREIDAKGWHKRNCTLGVILVELNGSDKNVVKRVIGNKVHASLCKTFGRAAVDKMRISFHFFPEESEEKEHPSSPDKTLYPDLITVNQAKKVSLWMKRIVDVIGSFLALIVLSPLFLVISILIKLTSEGPILFQQERMGQLGNRFTFLKFRSMFVDSKSNIHRQYMKRLISGKVGSGSAGIYKMSSDPRVTPLGRFLRKTSLDELPQFLNVLKGNMSLVGPRPPIPYEYERYDIWHRRRILEGKPGITGLWQVRGRSTTTFNQMVRMDLKYTKEWSLWLDMKLILQTPWVLLNRKGAY